MTGSVRATRTRRPAAAARRRAAPKAAGLARLQRKEGSCACGGGCPRCATEGAGGGLSIGAVDDPLEREADRVADQVMAMRDPAARPGVAGAAGELLQRQAMEEEEEMVQARADEAAAGLLQRQPLEEEEEELQAKSAGDGTAESAPVGEEGGGQDFGARVSALGGGGRGLAEQDRSFFEPRFGRDFGGVRLHTGPAADRLTREVGALAFTVGGDIAFRSGSYRPESNAGRNLIAHELTHVVQQGAAPEGGEGDAEAEHRGWSRGPPRLSRAVAKREKPVRVRGRAQRRRLQRHPVYISRHGSQPHLDNAAEFFRQWGYAPITTGVDSIEQVVADLATKTSIGRVTLVSHAHPDAVMMSMLTGGPGTVPERDWRVDFREDPKIDLDAPVGGGNEPVLPPAPEEVVKLERHFLGRQSLNTAIRNARREREDRAILDRIGNRDDIAVRQYLWWTMERLWLPDSGLTRTQQRQVRAAIDGHLDAWRQAIVARANAAGTSVPAEADFAAVRGAIRRGMEPMTFGRVARDQRGDTAQQLIESPSAPITRVLQDPQFSRNLEQVRGMIRDESWIEIQGCRAGSSRAYLQAVQDFFSHGPRRPRVTAPDWFQAYGNMGWTRASTALASLRRRLQDRHVRRALAHWYPIVMGGPMPEETDEEEVLRSYLQGPNVLPLVYPRRTTTPGAEGAFLIADGVETDAYLRWLSRHSYRLTAVDELRDTFFDEERSDEENIAGVRVDYLQQSRNLPSRILYRPDSDYSSHIISA